MLPWLSAGCVVCKLPLCGGSTGTGPPSVIAPQAAQVLGIPGAGVLPGEESMGPSQGAIRSPTGLGGCFAAGL